MNAEIKRCRYCGIEGDRKTLRYERGLMGEANYECRNVQDCGARIGPTAEQIMEVLEQPDVHAKIMRDLGLGS